MKTELITSIRNLKTGDELVYTGNDALGLSGFTKEKIYPIMNFYANNYGVVLIDDDGKEHPICLELLHNYFHKVKDKTDNVNHPPHYTWLKDKCGIEVIDITRHMDFCLGNAIKYILRAGHKQDASLTDNQKEIEDLKKAIWYIKDRIKQLGGEV